jgi:hypothetical protein
MSDMLEEGLRELDAQLGLEPETPAAAAEEAQPAEEQPPETEPQDEGRPRDEHGRFLPKEGEPEPEAEQTVEQQLLAGRFKSQEELEKGYLELDREMGARNERWQELKQLQQEFGDYRQEQQQYQQQQPMLAAAPQMLQNLIDEGEYVQAANVAAQLPDQGLAYQQVVNAWRQVDPNSANMYELVQQQRWEAYQAQQQTSGLVAQQSMSQAMETFSRGKTDLEAVAPDMLKVAEESPRILQLLQDPDPQIRVEILDYLYTKAKDRVGSTLASAQTQAVAQQQAETDAAKRQAYVGSNSQRVEADKKSPGEQWLEDMKFDENAAQYYGP